MLVWKCQAGKQNMDIATDLVDYILSSALNSMYHGLHDRKILNIVIITELAFLPLLTLGQFNYFFSHKSNDF